MIKHTDNAQQKEHVELVIHKRLQNLVRLQVLILDTSLILTQAVNGDAALSHAETAGSDRRVGEKDKHDNAPRCTKRTTRFDQQVDHEIMYISKRGRKHTSR